MRVPSNHQAERTNGRSAIAARVTTPAQPRPGENIKRRQTMACRALRRIRSCGPKARRLLRAQSNYFGDYAFTQAYGQVDGSVSYEISRSISVSADVSNLLNAKPKVENSFGLLRSYTNRGRRITGGVRLKF